MSKSFFNRNSLTVLFVLGIIVLISTSILSYLNSRDQESDHDFISKTYEKAQVLDKISNRVIESEVYRKSYLETGEKENLVTINTLKVICDSLIKQYRSDSFDNERHRSNSEKLKSLINEHFALINDAVQLQTKRGNREKLLKNINDKTKIIIIDLRNQIRQMNQEEKKSLNLKIDNANNSVRFVFYSQIGGILISSILFIVVFIVLRSKASKSFELENQDISREELEQIVRERTSEISQINQKLYSKVSELEKMESALKRSEQYYRMLFEKAHDAIIIFNPEGEIILDMNKAACLLYGFTREEFKGISMKSISKNVPQGEAQIKETLEKGYFHNFQSVHFKKDATEMLIEINATVVSYNGKPAILSINRDITDRILKFM